MSVKVSHGEACSCSDCSQIYRIRETHEELSKLLRAEEAQSLGVTDVFAPFARVPALQVSEFTAGAWNAAKDDYQRRMTPVEQSITQRLRQLFATSMAAVGSGGVTQPQQVFQDLRKYSGLLSMPIVASTLSSEKEALAKQVCSSLRHWQPVVYLRCSAPSVSLTVTYSACFASAEPSLVDLFVLTRRLTSTWTSCSRSLMASRTWLLGVRVAEVPAAAALLSSSRLCGRYRRSSS